MTPSPPPESAKPVAATDSTITNSGAAASATSATTPDVPAFGWSAYAERVNGRFAMVGFVAVLLVEAICGDTFLRWAGLMP
jgi:hypothetical protein